MTIPLKRQLSLLLETSRDGEGHVYSLPHIAAETGITLQTLHNLLNGKAQNPRLDTLQSLCKFFGISLDYFGLTSEAQCRTYLAKKKLDTASPLIQEIATQSQKLSKKGRHNVLTILQWIELGGNK
jgi:transcriptional regulator with XRE-family HTH domain